MYRILRREAFSDTTFLWDVEAPDVAQSAQPGHFVMLRLHEGSERIPLTVADFDLLAIWNRCAHLGCPVAYSPGSAGYVCPCHGGAYDSRGLVTGGPPPRPLDRVDIKIVDSSKSFTPEQVEAGKDRVPLAAAAKSSNPNLRVLVGKPYSIDQEQQPFALHDPGMPVSGTLSHLYPFT